MACGCWTAGLLDWGSTLYQWGGTAAVEVGEQDVAWFVARAEQIQGCLCLALDGTACLAGLVICRAEGVPTVPPSTPPPYPLVFLSPSLPLFPFCGRLGAVGYAGFSAFSNPWVAKAVLAALWSCLRFMSRFVLPV